MNKMAERVGDKTGKKIFKICKETKFEQKMKESKPQEALDLTVTTEDSKSVISSNSGGKQSGNQGLSFVKVKESSERKVSTDSTYLTIPSFLNDRKISSNSVVPGNTINIPPDFENKELYLVKSHTYESKLFFSMEDNFHEDQFWNFD